MQDQLSSARVLVDTGIALVNFPLGVILLFGSFWYNSPGTVGQSWARRWSYLFGASSGLCGAFGSVIAVAAVSGDVSGAPLRVAGSLFFFGCVLLGWWQVRMYQRLLRNKDRDVPRRWHLENAREVRRELRTVSRQGYLSLVVGLTSLTVLLLG